MEPEICDICKPLFNRWDRAEKVFASAATWAETAIVPKGETEYYLFRANEYTEKKAQTIQDCIIDHSVKR